MKTGHGDQNSLYVKLKPQIEQIIVTVILFFFFFDKHSKKVNMCVFENVKLTKKKSVIWFQTISKANMVDFPIDMH